ncbi:MAG: SdpI family protein [Bacteroidota bacterium]
MNTWLNPLFIICTSTGLIFIVVAIITAKYPPKKINHIYGYRTKNSMKSKDRWDFAQEYSTDLMQKYGIVMVLLGFLGYFTSYSNMISTLISLGIIVFLTIIIFYKTEKAITERFVDKDV